MFLCRAGGLACNRHECKGESEDEDEDEDEGEREEKDTGNVVCTRCPTGTTQAVADVKKCLLTCGAIVILPVVEPHPFVPLLSIINSSAV